MILLLKLAWREVFNNKRFSTFFILNLAVALTGLLTLNSIKDSIQDSLKKRSRSILAADFAVSARRNLSQEEFTALASLTNGKTESSDIIETFSMVASEQNSRLVELRAIQDNYPFYGTLKLKNQGQIHEKTEKDIFKGPNVWVYPELLLQLNLNIGGYLKVGDHQFKITDVILEDSAGGGGGFAFALPVYISRQQLDSIGLIQTGSTFYFSRLFKVTDETTLQRLDQLISNLNSQLQDPAIQIFTSENASAQVGRLLAYVGDYLGLAAIVALFLTALGQIFLFRNYLQKKILNMGIYKVLGLTDIKIVALYILQTFILSVLALIPSAIFVGLSLNFFESPIQNILKLDIQLYLSLPTLINIFALIFIGTIFICGPLLWNTLQQSHRNLFQPAQTLKFMNRLREPLLFLPAVISFYALSVWLSKSFKNGSLFFLIFVVSIVLMAVIGFLAQKILGFLQPKSLPLRIAIRNLRRDQLGSISTFVTFGLVVTLASLIPSLEKSIQTELKAPGGSQTPSLFIFDIQEDQIETYTSFLKAKNIIFLKTSPLIRARLQTINGKPFEKTDRNEKTFTREQETENRFRNRGFNLSYQKGLSESETIIEGQPFVENPPEPEISIEARFAERLKLKMGDRLEFDIQGVIVAGRIVNLRKVRWTSFQPNFFIQFYDGPLNDAPKTYLSTLGPMSPEKKSSLQLALAKKFPNISTIDVSQVIQRISQIVRQMSFALKIMAGFTFLVGLFILISMISYRVYDRRFEFNLMKILGANARFNRITFILETVLVVTIATLVGSALSVSLSFILTRYIFDSELEIHGFAILQILTLTIASAIIVAWLGIRQVLNSKPILLLRQSLQ